MKQYLLALAALSTSLSALASTPANLSVPPNGTFVTGSSDMYIKSEYLPATMTLTDCSAASNTNGDTTYQCTIKQASANNKYPYAFDITQYNATGEKQKVRQVYITDDGPKGEPAPKGLCFMSVCPNVFSAGDQVLVSERPLS